jgi:uncharacterized protein YraI
VAGSIHVLSIHKINFTIFDYNPDIEKFQVYGCRLGYYTCIVLDIGGAWWMYIDFSYDMHPLVDVAIFHSRFESNAAYKLTTGID